MNKQTPDEIKPYAVYSVNEAADLIGVDKKAIYTLGKNGDVPLVKIGKGYKVLGENILKYMGSPSIARMTPNVSSEDLERK